MTYSVFPQSHATVVRASSILQFCHDIRLHTSSPVLHSCMPYQATFSHIFLPHEPLQKISLSFSSHEIVPCAEIFDLGILLTQPITSSLFFYFFHVYFNSAGHRYYNDEMIDKHVSIRRKNFFLKGFSKKKSYRSVRAVS